MVKTIVIFGSTTGNTEALAHSVAEGLKEGNIEPVVKNVTAAGVDELADYDLILLGSSTSSYGALQDDFVTFHNKLAGMHLKGKRAAVFGCGDQESYPDVFCAAVDILEEGLQQSSAKIVAESLKIHAGMGSVVDEPAKEAAHAWALDIAKSV